MNRAPAEADRGHHQSRLRDVACGRSAVRDGLILAVIVTVLAVCSVWGQPA